MNKIIIHLIRQEKKEEKCILTVNTEEAHMSSRGAQPMAGAVQSVGNATTFEWVCKNKIKEVPKEDKRCRAAHDMCQDDEDREVATKVFDAVGSVVFNFNCLQHYISGNGLPSKIISDFLHKHYLWEIWKHLQATQNMSLSIIMGQPSKQQTSRRMHKIFKRTMKNTLKLMLMYLVQISVTAISPR